MMSPVTFLFIQFYVCKIHSWLVYVTVIHLVSFLYNIPLCNYTLIHLTILI